VSELNLRDALADLADQAEDLDLSGAAWRTARRRRHRRASAGVAAAVVVVAGIAFGLGVQSGGPGPAPANPVASGPHSVAPSPSPSSPSSSPPAPPSSTLVVSGETTFASPSGNITCRMDAGWVACDVAQESWALTSADLASCGQSALAGVRLSAAGKAAFDCRTDVLVPDPQQVLDYGQSVTVGDVTCASATSGVTCTNSRTGHGFFVSRQSFSMS
jgi:hypothetical protein